MGLISDGYRELMGPEGSQGLQNCGMDYDLFLNLVLAFSAAGAAITTLVLRHMRKKLS